ncbi:MAG: dihydroorotase [Candidatus Omnitrophica bacterium]|nr:dihydroorotase [Candidatus Omnitrophota bacterium]MBU4477584.1 dihydroorotase [Candidatus Omnitrophota bacterium]MCG2703612.1 dihydroorotase [Candidatus Omnitrophota bacterium]
MRLLIKNASIIDARSKRDEKADILIVDGKISSIDSGIAAKDAEVYDAKGMLAVPGFIDMHTHLREPGFEYKETILSGTQAAARGGFTTICCMPNTNPVADNQGVIEFIISQNRKAGLISVLPIGAITKAQQGKELSEIGDLKSAGAVALSDDGKGVMNAEVMRRAMEYASMVDLLVISHCEDTNLAAGGVMHEGYVSTVLGLKGIPRIAEIAMAARDIEIARFTGTRLHIAHVSCKETVELVRRAKKEGVRVSCECCPHHFTLTDEAVKDYDTNTKVNPPLREPDDLRALKDGLKDGTIDCIATDHAPHAEAEKDVEFDNAPFGITGLETALGLVMNELVCKGELTLMEMVERMSFNPARILNLDKGYIAEGADADITIIDPNKKWVVEKEAFLSKSHNSPFIGMNLTGKVIATVAAGRIVYNAAG